MEFLDILVLLATIAAFVALIARVTGPRPYQHVSRSSDRPLTLREKIERWQARRLGLQLSRRRRRVSRYMGGKMATTNRKFRRMQMARSCGLVWGGQRDPWAAPPRA